MHGAIGIPRPVGPGPESRGWGLAAGAIVAAGVVVRILAARGDLWLDEIWSLVLAREAGSVARVFGSIHHDNNHYLNTLWMLALGDARGALIYRLPSLVASAATLLLIASRRTGCDAIGRLTVTALFAFCPFLVQYDSEARGYASAALFAVAGYFALDALLERGGWKNAAAVAACATLGVLSHLTFAFPLAGFAAWAALELARRHGSRSRWSMTAVSFAPAAIALAALWAVDLRHIVIGGGPAYSIPGVLRDLLGGIVGVSAGWFEGLGVLVVGLAAAAVVMAARARDSRTVFFVVTIVFAPATVLVLDRPAYLAARYFFVIVPFLLVLTATALSALAARGWRGRFLYGIIIGAVIGAGLSADARLAALGRGRYAEAVAFMRANTPGDTATVGTDNDFRNGMVLSFHAEKAPGGKPFELIPQADLNDRPPRWFLIHDLADRPAPPAAIEVGAGRPYVLAASFPRAGISGWHWYVYRRAEDASR